jgi:hypothetical protein
MIMISGASRAAQRDHDVLGVVVDAGHDPSRPLDARERNSSSSLAPLEKRTPRPGRSRFSGQDR